MARFVLVPTLLPTRRTMGKLGLFGGKDIILFLLSKTKTKEYLAIRLCFFSSSFFLFFSFSFFFFLSCQLLFRCREARQVCGFECHSLLRIMRNVGYLHQDKGTSSRNNNNNEHMLSALTQDEN